MRKTYTIVCLSEAMSPITHMMRSEGNEALVAREPLMTPNGVRHVPYLSGNAIRHRMLRAPLGEHLIDAMGMRGKLSIQQLNFLLHGGNLTESGGRENMRQIADAQTLFPMIRLLGGTLPSQILAGCLQVWRGTLVCHENEHALRCIVTKGYEIPQSLRPAEWFVEGYQYTRGDAEKTHAQLMGVIDGPDDAKSNLMIFSGQQVVRHALFLHGFTLQDAAEVELGALIFGLSKWQETNSTIGGMASKGHGRLMLSILAEDNEEFSRARSAYESHVSASAEACKKWLEESFAAGKEKAKERAKESGKPKKAAKPTAEVSPAEIKHGELFNE